ncbi:hypothetical protein Tco_0890409 [Tanacetum coccineum]|uniref:Uncharacterized protein n=1 Tax=Tanacetum coccineum TaxID=301880 RepID=A0ABQ5C398_9ASTR
MVIDNGGKRKRQNEQLGVEGVKMLKVRVALDKKGVYNLKATQVVKKNNLKPINRTAPSVLAAPETQLDGKRHISYKGEFHGSLLAIFNG